MEDQARASEEAQTENLTDKLNSNFPQDTNKFLNSNELAESVFVRIGDTFLKRIHKYDVRGNQIEDYISLKKDTIQDLYGKEFVKSIPYYDSETIIPQNENYQRILGNSINRYFPPDVLPADEEGEIS